MWTRASRRTVGLPRAVVEELAALRDRLDAIYTAGQRDQDAAVVDLFQERSQPGAIPEHRGRRRHWAGNGCDLDGAAHR